MNIHERYGLHRWLYGRLSRIGDALYLFLAGSLAITVSGLAAYALKEPFLFPSLGPTVYLFFEQPLSSGSSPRSTLLGHFIALSAGYVALAVFGLLDAPNVLQAGVTPIRIGVATLSVGMTGAAMLLAKDSHPPAEPPPSS